MNKFLILLILFVIGFPMAFGQEIPDDFSVFIAKTNELIYNKKIFDDNISTKFYINNKSPSNILEISDSSDAKSGINSMMINVDVVDEFAAISHDFSKNDLQDWSNYNYIGFWFKGEKSFDTIDFTLRDADWLKTGRYEFVDDSDQWKKVIIPLKSAFFPLLDTSKVRGIEFIFNTNVNPILFIDDIQVQTNDRRRIFFDDNISTKFYINNKNPSNILEISDSSDAKSGINSMMISVDVVDEFAAISHDFSKKGLQDWSNYNYIGFWFKGEKSFDTIEFTLRDADWIKTGIYEFVDDSDQWKKVIIPLKSTFFPLLDTSKVRGILFTFKNIQIAQAQIANFQLSYNKYIMPSINNYDFIQGESLLVLGEVRIRDGESPIIIVVRDPTGNVSSVNKVVPSLSNNFNLTIPISGKQFNKNGLYSINTLYGNNVFTLPINFKVVNPQFLLSYEDFDIHKVGDIVYAIPNTEEFNLDRLRNDEYDIFDLLTSNTIPTPTAPTINDIKIKIDEITKQPKKLLEAPREIPDYLKKTDLSSEPLKTKEIIPIFEIIVLFVTIGISVFIAYQYILKKNKTTQEF